MLGLTRADFGTGETPVWPINVQPLNLFLDLATQWRVGPGGVIGLDYSVLPLVLDMRAVPRPQWPDLFDDLRVMEAEALSVIAENRENRNP